MLVILFLNACCPNLFKELSYNWSLFGFLLSWQQFMFCDKIYLQISFENLLFGLIILTLFYQHWLYQYLWLSKNISMNLKKCNWNKRECWLFLPYNFHDSRCCEVLWQLIDYAWLRNWFFVNFIKLDLISYDFREILFEILKSKNINASTESSLHWVSTVFLFYSGQRSLLVRNKECWFWGHSWINKLLDWVV